MHHQQHKNDHKCYHIGTSSLSHGLLAILLLSLVDDADSGKLCFQFWNYLCLNLLQDVRDRGQWVNGFCLHPDLP